MYTFKCHVVEKDEEKKRILFFAFFFFYSPAVGRKCAQIRKMCIRVKRKEPPALVCLLNIQVCWQENQEPKEETDVVRIKKVSLSLSLTLYNGDLFASLSK